jgi:uncharacterized protein (TIGR02147 family)
MSLRTDNNSQQPNLKTPAEFLGRLFENRRERNPLYSMRAFARDLGISISLLSRVLNGSRPVSLKLAMQISTALDLSESEANSLILSVLQTSSSNAKISKKVREKLEASIANARIDETSVFYTTVEIEQFKAIAHWYHMAILNLVTLEDFDSNPQWIASRLGITSHEARDAVERLIGLGLLEENEKSLKRTEQHFNFKTKRSEFAMRKFHEQMIGKATEELKNTKDEDFQKRLINSITFSCSQEQIELLKEKIDKFQDEILEFVSSSKNESVYQMNVQFFPLTKK